MEIRSPSFGVYLMCSPWSRLRDISMKGESETKLSAHDWLRGGVMGRVISWQPAKYLAALMYSIDARSLRLNVYLVEAGWDGGGDTVVMVIAPYNES